MPEQLYETLPAQASLPEIDPILVETSFANTGVNPESTFSIQEFVEEPDIEEELIADYETSELAQVRQKIEEVQESDLDYSEVPPAENFADEIFALLDEKFETTTGPSGFIYELKDGEYGSVNEQTGQWQSARELFESDYYDGSWTYENWVEYLQAGGIDVETNYDEQNERTWVLTQALVGDTIVSTMVEVEGYVSNEEILELFRKEEEEEKPGEEPIIEINEIAPEIIEEDLLTEDITDLMTADFDSEILESNDSVEIDEPEPDFDYSQPKPMIFQNEPEPIIEQTEFQALPSEESTEEPHVEQTTEFFTESPEFKIVSIGEIITIVRAEMINYTTAPSPKPVENAPEKTKTVLKETEPQIPELIEPKPIKIVEQVDPLESVEIIPLDEITAIRRQIALIEELPLPANLPIAERQIYGVKKIARPAKSEQIPDVSTQEKPRIQEKPQKIIKQQFEKIEDVAVVREIIRSIEVKQEKSAVSPTKTAPEPPLPVRPQELTFMQPKPTQRSEKQVEVEILPEKVERIEPEQKQDIQIAPASFELPLRRVSDDASQRGEQIAHKPVQNLESHNQQTEKEEKNQKQTEAPVKISSKIRKETIEIKTINKKENTPEIEIVKPKFKMEHIQPVEEKTIRSLTRPAQQIRTVRSFRFQKLRGKNEQENLATLTAHLALPLAA